MKKISLWLVLVAVAAAPTAGQQKSPLLYADFDKMENDRPVSARGGQIQIITYEESGSRPAKYTGLAGANPPAPELVRLKQDDPNHAATFEFEFPGLSAYAGVGIEIAGQPEANGTRPADDVSGYQYIQFDAYATEVQALRVELMSRGYGLDVQAGYPQASVKIKEGFNTYRLKLDALHQPPWAPKISAKEVLKHVTSLSITAYCEKCQPVKGRVVVDNVQFVN
jgi:hypothetical protein